MHFRLHRDVEFGIGDWRSRDDFLGLIPLHASAPGGPQEPTAKPCGTSTTTTSTSTTATMAAESGSRIVLPQDAAHRSSQYPKRVSFTAEETARPGSPVSFLLDHQNLNEDELAQAQAPFQVAEILRQMSRQSPPSRSSAAAATTTAIANPKSIGRGLPTLTGSSWANEAVKKKSAKARLAPNESLDDEDRMVVLQMLAKRKLPIPTGLETLAVVPPAAKRVRWLPSTTNLNSNMTTEDVAAFGPLPMMILPKLSTNLKDSPTVAALTERLEPHGNLQRRQQSIVNRTVIKPLLPGLEPYDVLIGRGFVSHFNVGNRRLLVLCVSQLEKYHSGAKNDQVNIVEGLYQAVRSAGGRFVEMKDSSSCCFEEMEKNRVESTLALVFQLLQQQQTSESPRTNIIQLFEKDFSYIWGRTRDEKQQEQTCDKEDSKPAASTATNSASDAASCSSTVEGSSTNSEGVEVWSKVGNKSETMIELEPDFTPGDFDVICCRGRVPKNHAGNKFFHSLVEQNCERYIHAETKSDKSLIVSEILDTVRREGGFVKQNESGRWCETGDHQAREKIGQCFRDRLHTRYSSSSKSKLIRRRNICTTTNGLEDDSQNEMS